MYITPRPGNFSANLPKAMGNPFTNSKVCHLRAAGKVLGSKLKHVGTPSSPRPIRGFLDNLSHHSRVPDGEWRRRKWEKLQQ